MMMAISSRNLCANVYMPSMPVWTHALPLPNPFRGGFYGLRDLHYLLKERRYIWLDLMLTSRYARTKCKRIDASIV
jgi:hypothetical protein